MKKWKEILEKRWAANLIAICGGVILYMLLSNFSVVVENIDAVFKMLSPIIIGLVIAYLVNPIANFIDQKILKVIKNQNSRWSISVILSIALVLILIVVFIIVLVPSLMDSFNRLIANAETYIANIEIVMEKVNDWAAGLNLNLNLSSITERIEEVTGDLLNYITRNMKVILNTSQNIGNSVFNGVIGFILGIYFLFGKRSLTAGGDELRRAALKEQTYQRHNEFWKRCHEILIQYIGYNLLDGLIVGIVNGILMLILGMPYVALISVVVGVTNLLPTFGPFIGGAIGAFILFLNRPVYALWFLIFTVILQIIDGYILKPKLFGGSLGIPAVWTLVAIIIGGKMFGVLGIFLATPVAAVVSFSYKERFLPWLKNRQSRPKKEEGQTENEKPTENEKQTENKKPTKNPPKP